MIGELVKGALRWMMLAKGVSQAISWLVTIVVIRILTPADYGLFAMASMLVVLAEMLKEMGLGSALVQVRTLTPLVVRQVYTLVLLSNAFVFAIIVLTAPLVAGLFNEESLEVLIPILALQFPIMALETVPEALLSREMDFRNKALIATTGAITNSFTTLTCALLGMGVWSLICGNLAAAFVRVIYYGFKHPLFYLPTFKFSGIGRLASFGGFVTLSRFLNVLLVQSTFFVVGRVLGKDALGLFAVANQLATLPMQKVSGILNEVGFAAFARIQDDRTQVREHYAKAMSVLAFMTFPVFWGLASVAEGVTSVFLGDKWLPIVLPLQLIALVTPLRMIFNTTTPALLGIGRADVFFWNLVMLNVIMPVAALAGTAGGVDGVSLAWLLAYPPLFLITQGRSLRTLGIRAGEMLGSVRMSAIIAFGMMALVIALGSWGPVQVAPDWLALAILVAFGGAVYVLSSLRFNRPVFDATRRLIYR